jgi:DNA-binding beta-propeller fold protein YncE
LVVPRWVLGVVAAAVAVAAVDIAVLVVTRDARPAAASAHRTQPAAADVVAVIDPATSRVVDRVNVGRTPTIVAAGYGGAWVLNKDDGTLSHLDAHSHHVIGTMRLDVVATDLAIGAGGVWFAGRPRGDVRDPLEFARFERIDPATGRVDRAFDTQTGAFALAAGGGALWSTGIMAGHVRGAARSDAVTGAMRKLDIQSYGDLIAADEHAAYWVGSVGKRVARVSTRTGLLSKTLPLATDAKLAAGYVGPNPTAVALGGRALWISAIDGSLIRVDPNLRRIVASIHVCGNALAVAYGEGAVWVACGDATVVRVDPSTNRPGTPIDVGALPRGIAAGDGAVWVTLN